MRACVCMDIYLVVNSSDWKGRKTDILTLKIKKAETGCLVCTRGDNAIVSSMVSMTAANAVPPVKSFNPSNFICDKEFYW